MRQKKAMWAIAGVSVVLVGVLIAFGCERSAERQMGAMEGEHHHGEPSEEHGRAALAPTHHEAVAAQQQARPELSGEVVDGVRVVNVTARQFEFDPPAIVVRRGEKVRLEVTSQDVTHGFGLEAYSISQVLPPGETKTIEFTADKAGRHRFHCIVYCGAGHDDMHGELVVLERSE